MARRYLGMTPAEWDALAWWEQKMYFEGYEWEELVEPGDGDTAPNERLVSEEVHHSGGTKITDRKVEARFSMVPGEFAAFGIPERTL